jgi:hypothetical protein
VTELPGTPADLWPDGAAGLLELPAGTNLWGLHDAGLWVVIPTNLRRKADGTAVMGAGLALAAARRFPDLAARYGDALGAGKGRFVCAEHRLLLAPTKDDWRRPATVPLVLELLDAVASWSGRHPDAAVALSAPGCGRGGLPWAQVRAAAMTRLAAHRVALLPPMPAGR